MLWSLVQINVLPTDHLTYSTGPRGSFRLRQAAANLLNEEFRSRHKITSDNIAVTPGLASAIDALSWAVCDEQDGILIPQPFYNGFGVDILNRSNVRAVEVPSEGVDGYSTLEDLFKPEVNRKAPDKAYGNAARDEINIRALLISHPHNPLGRCYPPETLIEFAAFCGRHQLHFISDEIYAFSVFQSSTPAVLPDFISTLALDLTEHIDPLFHHVMYGASKDFCANGLRLGFVCSRNRAVVGAMLNIGIFSWSPHVLQDTWAAMLEDKSWLQSFMTKKVKLMEQNYRLTVSYLQKHKIQYFDMNAGLFVWINLQHLMVRVVRETSLKTTSPDALIYKQRELRIAELCIKNGVMIAPGHVYMPEEFGWFRITFTVPMDALREGLERLSRSLKEAEEETNSL